VRNHGRCVLCGSGARRLRAFFFPSFRIERLLLICLGFGSFSLHHMDYYDCNTLGAGVSLLGTCSDGVRVLPAGVHAAIP
jgi:hypothetical protein